MQSTGYFGIAVYKPKTHHNIGTLWRTAHILGADFLVTIGRRYTKQCSDTLNTPNSVPLYNYESFDDFYRHLPYGCQLVGVELDRGAELIDNFSHPLKTCYLLGAEDGGLPKDVLGKCHHKVKLRGDSSLNVAVAGSIVVYYRGDYEEKRCDLRS